MLAKSLATLISTRTKSGKGWIKLSRAHVLQYALDLLVTSLKPLDISTGGILHVYFLEVAAITNWGGYCAMLSQTLSGAGGPTRSARYRFARTPAWGS